MKVDSIINEIKDTTNSVIIITNKATINHFFSDINVAREGTVCGEFEKNKNAVHAQGVMRSGVSVHFIDEDNIDVNLFSKSLINKGQKKESFVSKMVPLMDEYQTVCLKIQQELNYQGLEKQK